jgi:anti-anti-sigma regulatory factor
MPPTIFLIVLAPQCRGTVGADGRIAAGDELIASIEDRVTEEDPGVVVDLGRLESATSDDVKALTDFLWSLRVAGVEPAVACPRHNVMEGCRALKLDRAFPLETDRAAAIARLQPDG